MLRRLCYDLTTFSPLSFGDAAMLQPKTYPRLLGQALTLEPAPFVEMTDDDNPWIEGLFLAFVIGLAVAVARLIGGLLLTASLPLSGSVLEAIVTALKQSLLGVAVNPAQAEALLRQMWPWITTLFDYGSGWLRLLVLIATPLLYIGQWLVYGLLCHLVARLLGGSGSVGQTLGVIALSLAPRVLLVAMVIPFVSVSGLLVHVWGILIAYRGLEVAHDLPPARAASAVLAPLMLGAVVLLTGTLVFLTLASLAGGGA